MVWETVCFGDLFACNTRNGIYKPSNCHGSGVKVVNMGDIFSFDFISDQPVSRYELTESEYNQYDLLDGDLVFARRSLVDAGAGKVSIIFNPKEKMVFESSIIRVRLNKKMCDPLFYLYWFKSFNGQSAIRSIVTGTSVKGVKSSDLSKLKVVCPPLFIQSMVAKMLYKFDEQMLCLDRINDNLANLISNIFNKLIADNSQQIKLGSYVRIGAGGTPKTTIPEYWGPEIPFFSPKDISGVYTYSTEKYITRLGLDSCNSGLYPKNTTFITARGTVGKIALSACDMAMNQSCYAICSLHPGHDHFVHQLSIYAVHSIKQKSNGAVFDAINAKDITEELVPKVDDQAIDEFEKTTAPFYEQIWENGLEIQSLINLRDYLLPRLMSGEIDVSTLELST